jgi:protein STU2
LRKSFAKYRSTIMSPMMDRFKEKKQSVADALGAALDAVFASTSLAECLEDTLGFLPNKNPNVKAETVKFLVRCLRTTREVPSKEEQKRIADAGTKLLTESTENLRAGGAEILGTLMKIIGERAMNPYLDGLDDIRKAKIKEYFDTAEVKAKEKPKPAPAPAKATSAVGKKVVGGSKKLVAKKPSQVEDAASLQPKPTAKPLPKPTGLARPGLAQPSGMKLGGLKKPGVGALSSPRRVISPPVSNDGEEEAAAPSPSKFGMGRGGLAGRPLARPAAVPLSPPVAAPIATGMSAIERAELEELRSEKERLTALTDSLRSSNAKLTAEISELQNQNAQLIEDHTRDVLQIKAKETQLVRARGECDVLRGEVESVRKESERYKREVSRLGRESIGREREDMMRGRGTDDYSDAGGIYDDSSTNNAGRYAANGSNIQSARPISTALHRTGSSASTQSGRGQPTTTGSAAKPRPQSGYTSHSNRLDLSPSEEKENNGLGIDSFGAARRKISPPVLSNGASGRSSPQKSAYATTMSREASDSGVGGERPGVSREPSSGRPEENWKRAAEVTSQLKARIEAMKVCVLDPPARCHDTLADP